jgi:hypothetical protein
MGCVVWEAPSDTGNPCFWVILEGTLGSALVQWKLFATDALKDPDGAPTDSKFTGQLQDAMEILSILWDFSAVKLHRVECNMRHTHNLHNKWGSSAPAALVKC